MKTMKALAKSNSGKDFFDGIKELAAFLSMDEEYVAHAIVKLRYQKEVKLPSKDKGAQK